MASSKRVLFVAGEVTPFAELTDAAELVRSLAESLQTEHDVDVRIFMPRYGTISERKNNLHEVIRLSGTPVPMKDESENLIVKVASIPDTRLQVYFMDSETYMDRNGVISDGNGDAFEDNAERVLFFNRAVLETIKKLRWAPDVIHSFGWAGGLLPGLLTAEYGSDETLSESRSVFTPDNLDSKVILDDSTSARLGLALDDVSEASLNDAGLIHADAVIHTSDVDVSQPDASEFGPPEGRAKQTLSLYDRLLSEVAA